MEASGILFMDETSGNKHASELSILVQALPKSIKLWKRGILFMDEANWKQTCVQMTKPKSIRT
jgi:hypothetical protein